MYIDHRLYTYSPARADVCRTLVANSMHYYSDVTKHPGVFASVLSQDASYEKKI